jgi:excisionase family DNA binding protein
MTTRPNDNEFETYGDPAPSPAASRLLTAREVAGQLGVSSDTVLRWMRSGKLPGFRMPGGALRYREADLATWLANRATAESQTEMRRTSAGRRRTVERVSRSRQAGGDQDAVDPARSGVQARLW